MQTPEAQYASRMVAAIVARFGSHRAYGTPPRLHARTGRAAHELSRIRKARRMEWSFASPVIKARLAADVDIAG